MFGHEKFTAYQKAIEFVAEVNPICENLPRGNAYLIDQLRRASISIPLNIAEGSGKCSSADKRRFYAIARGSAMECAAIIDVLGCLKLVGVVEIEKPKLLLDEIAAVLTVICGA